MVKFFVGQTSSIMQKRINIIKEELSAPLTKTRLNGILKSSKYTPVDAKNCHPYPVPCPTPCPPCPTPTPTPTPCPTPTPTPCPTPTPTPCPTHTPPKTSGHLEELVVAELSYNVTIVTNTGNKLEGEIINAGIEGIFKFKSKDGIIFVNIDAIESIY